MTDWNWTKSPARVLAEAVNFADKHNTRTAEKFRQMRLSIKPGDLPSDGSSGRYDAYTETMITLLFDTALVPAKVFRGVYFMVNEVPRYPLGHEDYKDSYDLASDVCKVYKTHHIFNQRAVI